MRVPVILAIQLLIVGTAFAQRRLENIDALASRPATRVLSPATRSALNRLTRPGSKTHIEGRLGVPTFLWANRDIGAADTRRGSNERVEIAAARSELERRYAARETRAGGRAAARADPGSPAHDGYPEGRGDYHYG